MYAVCTTVIKHKNMMPKMFIFVGLFHFKTCKNSITTDYPTDIVNSILSNYFIFYFNITSKILKCQNRSNKATK